MADTPDVSYYHLFDTQAASYAVYRPTYPDELYQKVYSFAGCSMQNGYTRLAVDVATGSGQCAISLARHFTKVCELITLRLCRAWETLSVSTPLSVLLTSQPLAGLAGDWH